MIKQAGKRSLGHKITDLKKYRIFGLETLNDSNAPEQTTPNQVTRQKLYVVNRKRNVWLFYIFAYPLPTVNEIARMRIANFSIKDVYIHPV